MFQAWKQFTDLVVLVPSTMKVKSIGKRGSQERLNLLKFLWVTMDASEAMTVLRNLRILYSMLGGVSYPRQYCNIYIIMC